MFFKQHLIHMNFKVTAVKDEVKFIIHQGTSKVSLISKEFKIFISLAIILPHINYIAVSVRFDRKKLLPY